MGVMLSLDGALPDRGRKRASQRPLSAEEAACLDALAAVIRSDGLTAVMMLSKIPKTSLAGRVLPAVRALAQVTEAVLADQHAAPGPRSSTAPAAAKAPSAGGLREDATAVSASGRTRPPTYSEVIARRTA